MPPILSGLRSLLFPHPFHSRQQYHLCAVLFRIVFIMTRLNLVEGTDEYCIAGLAMKVRSELGFSMLESTYERALMRL